MDHHVHDTLLVLEHLELNLILTQLTLLITAHDPVLELLVFSEVKPVADALHHSDLGGVMSHVSR